MNTAPVHVEAWCWSLDVDAGELKELTSLLSADERDRADRLVQPLHRRRWVACRGRVRQLLGGVTGLDPAGITFDAESHGRPIFAHQGSSTPSFNLSHAEAIGALAVSFDARVGVDVEAIRPMTDDEMAWPLSEFEKSELAKVDGTDRFDAFFRFWTLKEAFVKAVGAGVSLPLEDFDISPPGAGQPRLMRLAGAPDEPARWRFAEHRPANGYLGAVAALTHGREMTVTWHEECL